MTTLFVPPLAQEVTLSFVSQNAGIEIYCSADQKYFFKRHDRAALADKESAMLREPFPFVKPTLLGTFSWEGKQTLCMKNVRQEPRIRKMTLVQAIQAVEILAQLNNGTTHQPFDPAAVHRHFQSRISSPGLNSALVAHLNTLPLVGDALCHNDLHISNWIQREGRVVGLLDWSTYGYADPEEDLAQLVLEAEHWENREEIGSAWERESGRVLDWRRFTLYFWLLLEEKKQQKTLQKNESQWLLDCTRALPAEPLQRPRVLWKPKHSSSPWLEYPHDLSTVFVQLQQNHVLGASRIDGGEIFTEHACNDILRFRANDTSLILKIYNKRNFASLIDLECHLADHVPAPALIPAPIRLRNGGRLFRIDGHLACLYPDLGDQRLNNKSSALKKTAQVQAAVHRCPVEPRLSLPKMPVIDAQVLERPAVLKHVDREQRHRLRAILQRHEHVFQTDLPLVIVHGFLHRDHCLVVKDRLAVIDWEKAKVGPRARAVARTAAFLGYRDNDEQFSPEKIIRYCIYYQQASPLTREEQDALPHFILCALYHDLKAIAQNLDEYDDGKAFLERHIGVILNFEHNFASFSQALKTYLSRYARALQN
ncbi:MAG: phosphotransferase [Myxococcota bacterium]|nr:phosphotransferase [Myxococcota bacterium]